MPPDLHPDDDHLARLALDPDGPADADLVLHLQGCPTCHEEVDGLRDLAGLARGVRSERLEPPPPQVWQGVVDELGLTGRTGTRSRSRPLLWAAAAAVVGLGAGSLGTWALLGDDASDGEVVRTAALEPLTDDATAAGTARLVEQQDGSQLVQVSASGLEEADGYLEVWLIRPGSDRMVSLGVLEAGEVGEFVVPATALEEGFTLVDVSDEPDDGEPTHSGDSVLRGDLAG